MHNTERPGAISDGWLLLDEWHIGVLVPAEIGPVQAADLRDEVGLEVVALAEQRDEIALAELQEHQRFRAGRLDHGDAGRKAVLGERQVLGADAVDHVRAIGHRRVKKARERVELIQA